mmetsp:Transcript_102854/g.289251  ORF Transcript_102854/g.289251 Transcript_102854/m.289251 type:complete len:414 (+) Transcript_102854:107-1348(+)
MAGASAVRSLLPVLLAWLLQATAAPQFNLDLVEEAGELPAAGHGDAPPSENASKQAIKAKFNHLARAASKAVKSGKAPNLKFMRMELEMLRGELEAERSNTATGADPEWEQQVVTMEKQITDLEDMLAALAAQEAQSKNRIVMVNHAELQAEIDRLKESVRRIDGTQQGGKISGQDGSSHGEKELDYQIPFAPAPPRHGSSSGTGGSGEGSAHAALKGSGEGSSGSGASGAGTGSGGSGVSGGSDSHGAGGSSVGGGGAGGAGGSSSGGGGAGVGGSSDSDVAGGEGDAAAACTPAPCKSGKDVDLMMPYGDLEPFGREDTAQELTQASIQESDAMVDQLERAEVAEEKRAIFRALTRLRGAAITSYDGIARAQTGSIDEFSRKNKWRKAHPLEHLANEESDVSRWAFPDKSE